MPDRPAHRVCVVGSGWQFTSGISYYTCRLASVLVERYPVSVVLMRRLIPRFLYPGKDRVGVKLNTVDYPAEVDVYNGVDWFWLPSLIGAIRSLRRNRPDVVVFQWWTGAVLHTYLVLAWVARSVGASIVIEFHETQDTGETKLRGAARYLGLLGGTLIRRSDGFVVHSEFDREAVTRQFGIEAKPMRVIPHGPYDQHLDGPAETAVVSSPVRPSDAVTILFFGTIRPYKGLEHLVEAFDGLSDEQVAGRRLVIVGETWEGWSAPLEAARASKHADRIEIVNRYVHDDEIGPIFDAADLVVLPYVRSSASGPLHIAMAHGLPVVVTDVGGLRESAGGYAGASWVTPASPNAIAAIIADAGKRPADAYTDPRSWQDSARVFGELFDELRP